MATKYVLIGNSAASLAAIDGIRAHDRAGGITLINREDGPAYSRVALPYYVAGEMTLADLLIRQKTDYAKAGVVLNDNENAVAIDVDNKRVELESGTYVDFDTLLIASGSEPFTPPIHGLDRVPHHNLWTLSDAVGLKQAAERARSAVVIGGGFIGMLAAEALRKLSVELTIVEMAPILLPQLLDDGAGRLFLQAVRERGVTVKTETRVESLRETTRGVDVSLASGETLAADMIVVTTGVQPSLGFLRDGTVQVNKGIVVNRYLATSRPGIYAAGDVAEAPDFLGTDRSMYAIWPTAIEQGRVAGANMAGVHTCYDGNLGVNVVELFGVTLAQIGRFREGPGDAAELLNGGGADGLYRKVVVDANRTVVGAVYLGNETGVAEMGVIHGIVKRRETWQGFRDGRPPQFTYAAVTHRVPR